MDNFWSGKRVTVLGGAALIGSHLLEALLARGCENLTVGDNLSSGNVGNLPRDITLRYCDARNVHEVYPLVRNADVVFHLACAHGGRGFVDTHKLECYNNLELDAAVFRACDMAHVGKVVFASSACVYPIHLQQDQNVELRLTEDLVDETKPMRPDGAYGWAKLSAEFAMNAYVEKGLFKGVATRFFTVYGPRMRENHAICALIAKSFIKQDPFEIWGDGEQIRNWTFVEDTVLGMLLAAEKMDGGAVNIGVETALTPNLAAEMIWDIMNWHPERIVYKIGAPTGPLNRVADATKAHNLLNWYPQVSLYDGLTKTIDWYVQTHSREGVASQLEKSLTER